MVENVNEARSLELTPTWSVASVLTVFVAVSLLVERLIHRLSTWLRKTNRKPLLQAVEKMKEGFISLLLTATSSSVANICIPSKFYNTAFAPCTKSEVDQETESNASEDRRLLMAFARPHSFRRILNVLNENTCKEARCLSLLNNAAGNREGYILIAVAVSEIHGWRAWEDDAHMDRHDSLSVAHYGDLSWLSCSLMSKELPTVSRKTFIFCSLHSVSLSYENLYHVPLMAYVSMKLVLLVGAKLQHVIATLALESAAITGYFNEAKLTPRDDLFWFKKPELLLSLIHFVLFQEPFACVSAVNIGVIVPFAGQFLCSYSTLPLYALVTQMGTNYKAALIPQRIRETIHGWGKDVRRRKRRLGIYTDDSTIHTDTSTVMSVEEYDDQELTDSPKAEAAMDLEIELQPHTSSSPSPVGNETSSRVGTPLLRPSASISSTVSPQVFQLEAFTRSFSVPARKE
ncbi:hypothetical protein RHSIM_Rhsim06G0196900 [Rhododendron simsii]|uniref:MLO-like protein n=1 Tax=Rhododendron simsii TaxID=118357 RepID=A0A834GVZ6_RHOSS|nr:hypothetical protein RHSIM_Rhsim06G0196900 [Rhododendron simsii]